MAHWDVIVVGSGSAGAVLAERLTRGTEPGFPRVLLLEAGLDWRERAFDAAGLPGGIPSDPIRAGRTRVRANATQDHGADHEHWEYFDQFGVHHDYAKEVGGSSAHNGLQSMTGTRTDHALWPDGWQYEDLAPFYREVIERMNVRPRPRLTLDHGALAFERAAVAGGIPGVEQLGIDFNDAYARSGQGGAPTFSSAVGPTTANVRGLVGNNNGGTVDKYGGRQSVLETYIEDVRGRANLTLRPNAWVTHVDVRSHGRSHRAESVTFVDQLTGEVEGASADLVVLCCSVIGTPALLMRSNIGPLANPRSSNRHVALRHVGRNYRNQPVLLVGVEYEREIHPQFGFNLPITVNLDYDDLERAVVMGVQNIAHPSVGAGRSDWGAEFKDLARNWRRTQYGFVILTHPRSTGELRFDESKDNAIDIDFVPDRRDLIELGRAADRMREIFESINGLSLGGELAGLRVRRTFAMPGYAMASHGVATCRMGSDARDSVVSSRTLLVHGFENLMVVDGSVFPGQVQSPHVPISAVALRAAETIVRPLLGLRQPGDEVERDERGRGAGRSPLSRLPRTPRR